MRSTIQLSALTGSCLNLLVLLLLLPNLTSATCNRFVLVGSVFSYSDASQAQQVSNGTVCGPTYNNNSNTIGGYGSCTMIRDNVSSMGCEFVPSGYIRATGFNNLSLSPADSDPIYELILNSQPFNKTNYGYPGIGMNRTFGGCVADQLTLLETPCLVSGQAGYIKATPELKCVNGNLFDCTDGPVADGTAISICGVGYFTFYEPGSSGTMDFPAASFNFVDTTVEQALSMTSNPADNATCTAFYESGAGSLLASTRSTTLMMAAAAVAAMVLVC